MGLCRKKLFIGFDEPDTKVITSGGETLDEIDNEQIQENIEKNANNKKIEQEIGSHISFASLYRMLAMRAMEMSIFSSDEEDTWDGIIFGLTESMEEHLEQISALSAMKSGI